MAYTAMTDLVHGQLVTEAHMDTIRENIEFFASLLFGTAALSTLANGAVLSGMTWSERGTYSGNGAGSAGSGGQVVALARTFTPNLIIIAAADIAVSAFPFMFSSGSLATTSAGITAIGSGQFTVSDGGTDANPNKNGAAYAYLACIIPS